MSLGDMAFDFAEPDRTERPSNSSGTKKLQPRFAGSRRACDQRLVASTALRRIASTGSHLVKYHLCIGQPCDEESVAEDGPLGIGMAPPCQWRR